MATQMLKDIVPYLLANHSWQTTLARRWNEVVGNLKTRIRLEKIYDDTLVVGVYEYHWMQELYLLSPLLRDSINGFLGKPYVSHLRFVLVDDKERSVKKQKPKLLVRPEKIILSSGQQDALESIEDESFKKTLIEYWGRCCALEDKG